MSKLCVRNQFDIGTSQSRQNLGRISREEGEHWARAREPIGEGGIPHPGQKGGITCKRERVKETALIRASQGPTQKTAIFILVAVRTSSPTCKLLFLLQRKNTTSMLKDHSVDVV
jgi:hypothetical protein